MVARSKKLLCAWDQICSLNVNCVRMKTGFRHNEKDHYDTSRREVDQELEFAVHSYTSKSISYYDERNTM